MVGSGNENNESTPEEAAHSIEERILAGELADLLDDRSFWPGTPAASDVLKAVSDVSRSGERDVLADFQAWASTPGKDAFRVRNTFWHLVTLLDISAKKFLSTVAQISDQIEDLTNDGYFPESEFATWLRSNPVRVSDLVAAARQSPDSEIPGFHVVLKVGAEANPRQYLEAAVEFAVGTNARRRRAALVSLSEMALIGNQEQDEVINFLEQRFRSSDKDDRRIAVVVMASIVARHPVRLFGRFRLVLEEAKAYLEISEWRDALANILSRQHKALDADLLEFIFAGLSEVDDQFKDRLPQIGHALYGLIDSDHWLLAIEFLEDLISGPADVNIEQFQTLQFALTASHHFPEICCRWFSIGRPALCEAVSFLIGHRQTADQPLTIDRSVTEIFSPTDRLRMARRSVGWLLHQPVVAASFLVGALISASDSEADEICKIFVSPLLACYGGATRQYVERMLLELPQIAQWLQRVLDSQTDFQNGLPKSHLKELAPTDTQRVVAADLRNESQAEIAESVQSKSPLLSLIHRQKILFGDATVSYFPKAPGSSATERSTLQMQTFGFSYEHPRLETWDAVGLHLVIYMLRTEPAAK